MNRSRTNHLLKIEKENENTDIKIKQKINQPRGYPSVLTNAPTSNTDKCSQYTGKISTKYSGGKTKIPSNNDAYVSSYQHRMKSQLSIASIHQREQTAESTNTYVKSIGIFPNHKPLSPYMAPTPGPKPRLGQRQIKPPKQAVSPSTNLGKNHGEEICTMPMYSPCSTDNLEEFSAKAKNTCSKMPLSASTPIAETNRSNSTCKRSESARLDYISPRSRAEKLSTCSGSSAYLNLDLDICSLSSPSCESEHFYIAPLIPVPHSKCSSDSGASLERKFRDALDVNKSFMEEDDIKLVKTVLKTDNRHSLLGIKNADPNIFKDILKSQLKDIIRNEKVVKSALIKLGTPRDIVPDSANGVVEISEILSPNRNKGVSHNSRHKSKKKRKPLPLNPSSEDSSPEQRCKSIYQEQDVAILSDHTENQSPKHSNRYYEKRYLYSQREESNLKHEKTPRSKSAQKEYEEFVKNTIPFKQKSPQKKEKSPARVIECPSQIQMQLAVQDSSEDSPQKLKARTARRPQVNVTFKNVPSPQKEILILRALGDRLEATLKRTISEPSLSDSEKTKDIYTSSSMSSLTKELHKIDSSIRIYPGRRFAERRFGFVRHMDVIPWKQQREEYLIFSIGLRHEIGIVNEFAIVLKTIDELRNDANSSFYIPKSGRLLCTSFENLKKEPDLFLQILKPKTAGQPFNLLDHDAVFFHSLLKLPIKTETNDNAKREEIFKNNLKISEGGDSIVAAAEGIKKMHKKLELKTLSNRTKKPNEEDKIVPGKAIVENEQKSESSNHIEMTKLSAPFSSERRSSVPFLKARRSRIRRLVTPMPFDAFDEPKNTLIKKVLIGIIQVSIFMGLIMALTLPDIKC